MNKIVEGMQEALAIARGEKPSVAITVNGHRYVPASPYPLADGMRDHYLAQSRAADQVRRVIAASTRPMDEDDGA